MENTPVSASDALGLEIIVWRKKDKEKAIAWIIDDSVQSLADRIGLDANVYTAWLDPGLRAMPASKDEKLRCVIYRVPNTIAAWRTYQSPGYSTGAVVPHWDANVKFLQDRGFFVEEHNHELDPILLGPFKIQNALAALATAKKIHGFFYTGHGLTSPSTGSPTLTHKGEAQVDNTISLAYKLAFTFMNGCDSAGLKPVLGAASPAALFWASSTIFPASNYTIADHFSSGAQGTN